MMSEPAKVAVIGAGSTYTPELIEGLIQCHAEWDVRKVSLMDIDEQRLDILGSLSARMVEAAGLSLEVETSLDRRRAIDGADFVISQIRVGGMDARILDETIPPKFGVIGQETTGPGGFASALRTIPVAIAIAHDIEVLAPRAVLVNFTNPAGLITEAVSRHSPVRCIGLCNLPIGTEMRLAEHFGVDHRKVRLDWVGLNHLNWVRGASLDGEEAWSKVFTAELDKARTRGDDGWNFSADLLETLGMIPCGYLNYYYNRDQALEKQLGAAGTRGEEVKAIEQRLMEMYRDPKLKQKPELLQKRGGAFYSKAAVSLMSGIANDKKEIHIVNVRNQGAIPDLPPDVVVEVPCRIDQAGAAPLPTNPLPPEILGLVQAVKAYELLTIEASVEGDWRKARQALLAHPLTPSFRAAQGLTEALLVAHRDYLPQFFAQG